MYGAHNASVCDTYNIRCEASWPAFRIQAAVLPDALSAVVKHIRVEELASLRHATGRWVGKVVHRLRRASGGAETSIKRSGRKDLDSHICVVASAVQGSVDCSIAESYWSGVASWSGDAVVDVAVGASDHNVEVIAPLAVK